MKTDKKIKTAIIGLGKITWAYEKDPLVGKSDDFPTHFRVLSRHPNFYLAAAQDKSAKAGNSFLSYAKDFGLTPKVYEDWEAMIKKENPGLLVVASSTESHYEICSRAIDLGIKNILCEKPISFSLKEARKLVQKAEKNKCVLFVNYPRAFNPSYIELCKKIQKGFFGKIQSFDAKYSKGIFNNGTHVLDLLIRMFGEVKKVQGLKNLTCDFGKVDPTVSATISFENGVSGYIHGLNGNFYNIFELDIIGGLGRLKMVSDKDPRGLIDTTKGHYHVYDNIYSGINRCSGRDSLKSLEVANKIIKSIKK